MNSGTPKRLLPHFVNWAGRYATTEFAVAFGAACLFDGPLFQLERLGLPEASRSH